MIVKTRIIVAAVLVASVLPASAFALTARDFATDPGLVDGAPGDPSRGGALLPPGVVVGDPMDAYTFAFAPSAKEKRNDDVALSEEGAGVDQTTPDIPYDGPLDVAYGAYQRGFFEAAYDAATERAARGDPHAETLIAELIERKLIAKSRAGEASDWYRMAADSGAPFAVNRYGMYLLGLDDEDKREAGRELVRQAAEAGNPLAAFNLATILVQKQPGPEGLLVALPWFEAAAQADVADAQYALSQIYRALEDIPEEKRQLWRYWLRRAANGEHDTAQLDLALALINGTDMPRNLADGVAWMHRSALNGNAAAASKLSYLYLNGIGTPVNEDAALTFYLSTRALGLKDQKLEDLLGELSQKEREKLTLRSHAVARRF